MKTRIGVFGDSFADRNVGSEFMWPGRKDESWMQVLEDSGYIVESYGLGGTSPWFSYQNFLGLHKYFQVCIFVLSHSARIHTLPKNLSSYSGYKSVEDLKKSARFHNLDETTQQNLSAMVHGASLLSDPVFDIFVVQKIFEDVNRICKEKNIKLITILPFENEKTIGRFNVKNSHGDCLYNLLPVALREMQVNHVDSRYCHLSEENNLLLGNLILENMPNRLPKQINLDKDVDFIYSQEITDRYQSLLKK